MKLIQNTFSLLLVAVASTGCLSEPDEIDQTIENLIEAGFVEDDISVVEGKVYVGNDSEVTLEASTEMLVGGDDEGALVDLDTIQYRTRNLVQRGSTICLENRLGANPALNLGFLRAFIRFDNQTTKGRGLDLKFKGGAPGTMTGCDSVINVRVVNGPGGGSAGFPANGRAFHTVNIHNGTENYGAAVASHVIGHEIGHTIGFRHTDFFNRSISCGSGGNEGDGGVGAIHVPGTPIGAVNNGSLMNSCFNNGSNGEFTATDKRAFRTVY